MISTSPAISERRRFFRSLLIVSLAAMVGMHIWVFFTYRREIRQGYPDFIAFYAVGKCVQRGLRSQLYQLDTQARLQQEFAPALQQRNKLFPWIHPAFEALALWPLAYLPYVGAYWLWNALSVAALVVFVVVLRPFLPKLSTICSFLPFLCAFAFFPVFDCLAQGQDSIFLLLLLGLAFTSLKRKHDWSAGIWLGLGLFRYQLVLPVLVVLAWQRKWKTLGGCAAIGFGLAAVSAGVVGGKGLLSYPSMVLACNRMLQSSGARWNQAMPNLRGAVDRLMGAGSVTGAALIFAISAALLIVSAWRGQPDPQHPDFELRFSLAVVVSTMISYYLFAHDLTLLLLPLLLSAEWLCSPAHRGTGRRLLLAAVGLLFFSPLFFLLWFHYHSLNAMFWVVALLAAGLSIAKKPAPARAAVVG